MGILQLRRLTTTQRMAMVPADGEPIWDKTLKVLYVGDGATTGGVTAESSAYALLASSISDGDTTHAPDGNSVFDALALKAPLTSPSFVTPALGTPASGTLTNCTGLSQAGVVGLTTADSPVFATVKCSNLTDGYIPKHTSDAVGLTNGPQLVTSEGAVINRAQPAFLVQFSGQSNVTGDSTSHIINFTSATIIYDQSSIFNTIQPFIAPCSGIYQFYVVLYLTGLTVLHTIGYITLVITGQSYIMWLGNLANLRSSNNDVILNCSMPAKLTIGDTASISIVVGGGTKVVSIGATYSFFGGGLSC